MKIDRDLRILLFSMGIGILIITLIVLLAYSIFWLISFSEIPFCPLKAYNVCMYELIFIILFIISGVLIGVSLL